MDATHRSSPAPEAVNKSSGTEDTSVEHRRTPEPAQIQQLGDRDKPPSMQEILQMTSTTMNFISTITTIFHETGEQNSRFRQELRQKILFLAMNTYAWASARAVHEHTAARDKLGAGVQKLVDDEKDQDRMRERLSEMYEAINNTVANLAGLC